MKNKIGTLLIFVLSGMALIISIKLFWNMGIFVDEFNTSPCVVCGGDFWLDMDWLRLGILIILFMVSGRNLFRK